MNMHTADVEQYRSNLALQEQTTRREDRGSIDLYQHTSNRDWAMQHESDADHAPSRVEVVQRSMGQKGRLLIWIGLALMLII